MHIAASEIVAIGPSLPGIVAARHSDGVALQSGRVRRLAYRSMLREVLLTPKPGLVDRDNTGAHTDMDVVTFLASARAIERWFGRFIDRGLATSAEPGEMLLALIRPDGMACERDMLRATGGVNTHKGSIFALGLLCGAAGRLMGQGRTVSRDALCDEVRALCAGMVEELRWVGEPRTAGERLYRQYALTGARGEAASGFATVRCRSLPVYEQLTRGGEEEETALHGAFLELLAFNPDNNLVSRGGLAGLAFVQAEALAIRQAGGVHAADFRDRMRRLDAACISRNLSPGGSADLLAVTWFLSRFPAQSIVP